MVKSKEEILNIINHSMGTTVYHRLCQLDNSPVITEGVLALAEAAECFWFLDVINSYQGNKEFTSRLQVWKLEVQEDASATVYGYSGEKLVIQQEIEYTDFPLDELELYLIDGIILLSVEC